MRIDFGSLRCCSDGDCLPSKCSWELLQFLPHLEVMRRAGGYLTDEVLVVLVSQHAAGVPTHMRGLHRLHTTALPESPQALTHLSNYGV